MTAERLNFGMLFVRMSSKRILHGNTPTWVVWGLEPLTQLKLKNRKLMFAENAVVLVGGAKTVGNDQA